MVNNISETFVFNQTESCHVVHILKYDVDEITKYCRIILKNNFLKQKVRSESN